MVRGTASVRASVPFLLSSKFVANSSIRAAIFILHLGCFNFTQADFLNVITV